VWGSTPCILNGIAPPGSLAGEAGVWHSLPAMHAAN